MTTGRRACEEVEARLREAEDVLAALRNLEVDAIVGDTRVAMVRLREVDETLRRAEAGLERQAAEGTADLARADRRPCESLREQADLLDLTHDMIFVHDMEGRIVFWNRGAERGYGWKREEALGKLSDELLGTEYCEPLIRIASRIIRDGRWEGELTHTARDGRRVIVATRWALRRAPDGTPTAILEIDNDITQRRLIEQELAEARRFAESVVDAIGECLVVLDSQLRIVSANRSFHKTFGTTHEQVRDRFFFSLHDGSWDLPDLREEFRRLLTEGRSFERFELEHGSAGERRSLVLGARPVREQAAGAGTILATLRDVTVCKRQEREIRTDKQQLASLTEELVRIEERQHRQIAKALQDSIGESLTQIERELDALHQAAPAAMQDLLRRLRERVRRAVEETESLSRDLRPVTLDSQGLTEAIRELADQFHDCEGFTCRVQGGQELLPLLSPVSTLLYRAVRELLVNVVKHAGADAVEIAIERDDRNVRVCVIDDGRGFDPAALESAKADGGSGLRGIQGNRI